MRSKERSFRHVEAEWDRFADPSGSPEAALLVKERIARVTAALKNLSPQQRNCLFLRSEGFRYREIAEIMGISQSSVNEFLRRAIGRLAEVADE